MLYVFGICTILLVVIVLCCFCVCIYNCCTKNKKEMNKPTPFGQSGDKNVLTDNPELQLESFSEDGKYTTKK